LSPLGVSPNFNENKKPHLDGFTNNDDKTGYDEDFDEEDSKSDLNVKKKSKREGATQDHSSKGRKQKEDPRRDFVNDFFKQNLSPATLNAPSSSHHKKGTDMTSSKMKDTGSNLPKNSLFNDWQNDILKNL